MQLGARVFANVCGKMSLKEGIRVKRRIFFIVVLFGGLFDRIGLGFCAVTSLFTSQVFFPLPCSTIRAIPWCIASYASLTCTPYTL